MIKLIKNFIFAITLIFTFMLFGITSVNAETVTGNWSDGITYSYDTTTGVLILTSNGSTTVEVSTVVYDEDSSFAINEPFSNISRIVISEGITSIGDFAFANWNYAHPAFRNNLTIEIPSSITSIGNWAFSSITRGNVSVIMNARPSNITTFYTNAFNDSNNGEFITPYVDEWKESGKCSYDSNTNKITFDGTYQGIFTLTVAKYTVTFKDYDGTVLKTQENVEGNTSATAPSNPTRDGYTFTSWDKSFDNITENLVVTAQYEINKYTVTFKDYDGSVLKAQENVEYNTSATAPSNPTRDGYTFVGWDKSFDNVTEDLVVTAQYEINKYTVIFKDYDGSVLKAQENVDYNTSATAPSNPTRDGYTFAGWDKSFDNVTEDLVVTAQYILTPGEVEVKEVEGNVGSATASLNNQNVEDLIELSSDEQNAIATGKDIYVFVEIDDISDSVSNEDKGLVKTKLEDASVVGMYLNINLFKQVEGKNKIKVEEINDKIKISFEIPESLRSSNREFYIIRVHGSEVTKIVPSVNGNTLTFETDRFSTYALVYTDTVEETITTEETTPTQTNTTSNPKTGDNVMFYISMLGLSIIGLIGTGFYVRKKRFN